MENNITELEPNMRQSFDRVLHMSDDTKKLIEKVELWASMHGISSRLENALYYLRTFSGGPERDWKTYICPDMFFNPEKPSFIASVYRRRRNNQQCEEYLAHYMTIGMIYNESQQDWDFHS